MDCTIRIAKTKALISFAVTAKLICVFVFAYAKSRFSHDEAQIVVEIDQENNNNDFWTILFAAKDRGGLILYLYLKESLSFYYKAFVLMCFDPGLDFGYSLERFIEAVLTCDHNIYVKFEQK